MKADRSATLPLGSIGFEREPDAAGERLIWLSPHDTTGPRRRRQRARLRAGKHPILLTVWQIILQATDENEGRREK
jgi:hypothetical protein